MNSVAMPRWAWRKLAGELHALKAVLCRLRSSSSDARRLGLIALTGAEAEMVESLAACAEMATVASDEVSPLVLG